MKARITIEKNTFGFMAVWIYPFMQVSHISFGLSQKPATNWHKITSLNHPVGGFLSRIGALLFNIKTPVLKKVLDLQNLRL